MSKEKGVFMKIQIISYRKENNYGGNYDFTYSTLAEPMALDMFDINIISLQDNRIWYNDDDNKSSINIIKDFETLKTMIEKSCQAKTIILLPLNYDFMYDLTFHGGQNKYFGREKIKNILDTLCTYIISDIIPNNFTKIKLIYEKSITKYGETNFNSDFCFEYYGAGISFAESSGKLTTISLDKKLYLSTINISEKPNKFSDFLKLIGLDTTVQQFPEWLKDVEFFDDNEQKANKLKGEQDKQNAIELIKKSEDNILKNLKYKSILTETGNNLVSVVFDILEQILNCDLSSFKDKKKEDFLIDKGDVIFIGEIKGINTNVKSANISQLDVHYQNYMEESYGENNTAEVVPLLIIATFRDKPLNEREPVQDQQIKLANRNGCTIITTDVLLFIYDLFLKRKISSEDIISKLKDKVGLFDRSQFGENL